MLDVFSRAREEIHNVDLRRPRFPMEKGRQPFDEVPLEEREFHSCGFTEWGIVKVVPHLRLYSRRAPEKPEGFTHLFVCSIDYRKLLLRG
jgi:hypothetical protein